MFSIYEKKEDKWRCRSFVLCLAYVAISPFIYFYLPLPSACIQALLTSGRISSKVEIDKPREEVHLIANSSLSAFRSI